MFAENLAAVVLLVALGAMLCPTEGTCAADSISLDGEWQFRPATAKSWRAINVPGSWESQFADLREYSGQAVYRTQFHVPQDWQGKAVTLNFGAVDWRAEVTVNGKHAGLHEGGYTSFRFDVTRYVRFGRANDLQVTVTDAGPGRPAGDLDFSEIPHGKQSWYGTQSGIWQSVFVEALSPVHIARVRVTPDIDRATAMIEVALNEPSGRGELKVAVTSPDAPGASAVVPLAAGKSKYTAEIELDDPTLWEPDSPYLYTACVTLKLDGKIADSSCVEFGMRKIEARDNLIFLNNHPIFLIGALDQDFYPGTEYTPPSDQFLKTQFIRAKRMGLNMLRCHIKIPDPRYLEWADRVGIIVWYEIPNFDMLTDKSKARARDLLTQAVERDYNHPSLCIISIINEGWGIDSGKPEHRAWQKEMYDYAKSLDPTRLIVDNSACGGNFHLKTDIEDYHAYYSVPDHYREYASWVAGLAKHPDFTFSPHGDAERRGWEPLMLSEFGNWGLPRISRLREGYKGDPWWFATGRGATHPAGAEERFREQRLDRVFADYDALAQASQWQEWISLKYEIEEMRKHPQIVGYVITEFTDLNWESNGLLDMCRNYKAFYDELPFVQAQDVIIPDWRAVNFWGGSRFSMDVLVSHFSTRRLRNCTLKWDLKGSDLEGEIGGLDIREHTTAKAGTVRFAVPLVEKAQKARVRLILESAEGELIAENYQEVNLFPLEDKKPERGRRVSIWDPTGGLTDLRARMESMGYEVADDLEQETILITSALDDRVRGFAQDGGRVILLARDRQSIPRLATSPLAVKSRDESGWWGDWCSSFIWFRKAGPMTSLPLGQNLDFEFHRMIPKSVIAGFDLGEDADDVFSGIFVGWLHRPAAMVGQFRTGDGRVLVTTLDVAPSFGEDPAATVFLRDMVEYASGTEFRPVKEVDLTVYVPPGTAFVPTAEFGPQDWRFTTEPPGDHWQGIQFDDSHWKLGKSGFGTVGTPNTIINTAWDAPDIWIRRTAEIGGTVKRAIVRCYHDEDFEVYLNGKLLLRKHGYVTNYEEMDLDAEALKLFRPGKNVLAVHCRQTVGGQYVDVGLWYE